MSFVCLWSPAWRIGAGFPAAPDATPDLTTLAAVLLGAAPRIVAERRTGERRTGERLGAQAAADAPSALLWADGHGLDASRLAQTLLDLLNDHGIANARAGIAATPIAAELAAMSSDGATSDEATSDGATSDGRRASGERRVNGSDAPGTLDDDRDARRQAPVRPPGASLNRSSLVAHSSPAARHPSLSIVPPGTDRDFIASCPVAVLERFSPDPRLRALLFGIGVTTCGELAALDRESIEVRLGGVAVPLWRLARADDRRLLFAPMPRELPHASFDCLDYTLASSEQLLFIINRLARRITDALTADGQGARELTLDFSLDDGSTHRESIRSSRPTANRSTWTRLIRTRLERVTLGASVTGVAMQVAAAAAKESRQGDLFDRGFATAQATDDALARLVDDQGAIVALPQPSAHPLIDRREKADARVPSVDASSGPRRPARGSRRLQGVRAVREPAPASGASPTLMLQLIEPRPIEIRTTARRDHHVPVRYGDEGRWHDVIDVAGPDRISGGHWDGAYAREYFRCVTGAGLLVWIFRDARTGTWYLHGWWD